MIFPELPGNSKVWIYSSDKPLTQEQSDKVKLALNKFLSDWAAHGKGLFAKGDLLLDRFVVIAVDEEKVKASGCSIDSSVHFLKELGSLLKIDFFNRLKLYIVKDQEIKQIHISDLINHPSDLLFDPMMSDLQDFRLNWITKVENSILYKQYQ
jgi:hypothetical protein